MELLFLYLITTLSHFLRLTYAETGSAYHGPPQARELFSYNDGLFYFYSDRVPFDEASAICEAGNMHLADLDDPEKAKFAAESIAEAWMVFEDMWIGARKIAMGKWIWQWTGKRIPEESQMLENFTYVYPPWLDNEVPVRDGKDCLAIDRNGHNDPFFVDLDCKLPRPFICEQNTKQNKSDPWNGGAVDILNMEFMLYHGRLSWPAAVSFCRQQGFSLATVENVTVARKLAKGMLKSRPEFEDAWIGANFKDNEWIWVETGEEIKNIPGEYKDPNKGETPENTITPQFPPWFDSQPRREHDCVIFDRHLCDEPRFIDLKCNRQRDFICMKREKEAERIEETYILDREKKRYIFFPVAATWDEGKRICDEESEATTMLNLKDIDETKFIMQAMSDSRKPIDHIWLGGRIINGAWMWVGKDLENPLETIPTRLDETGFPPWCDNETNLEMSCLNLDRQNHWTPLIYGLECNSTQAVVCVQPVEPNDRIVKYVGSGKDDPPVSLRVTKLVQNPISWLEAETACVKEIGKLWRPRFDLPDSLDAINKFFVSLKEGQDKENEVEVYHVNGGVYNSVQKSWVFNKKLLNITTGWKPYDGDCLVGQINNTANEWTWFPIKCYHKLYAQVICEPKCSLEEVPYEMQSSEWICDAASSDVFDHKMINMGCNHHCRSEHATQGPERFYCMKNNGWNNPQSQLPVKSSECKDVTNALDAFKDIPKGITSLSFVIDSTSDSPQDYNASKFLIGNLIDYYRAQIKDVLVFVVSIEPDPNGLEGAVIKVKNFKPTENCKEIKEQVLNVLVDNGEGIRDYSAGLSKIKKALADVNLGEANIVFMMPEGNQKGVFKDRARELNEAAKVYAIGTNRHAPIRQLVDIASKINGESFAIQFKKPPQLIESVQQFIKTCIECKCGTAFDDLLIKPENPGQDAN